MRELGDGGNQRVYPAMIEIVFELREDCIPLRLWQLFLRKRSQSGCNMLRGVVVIDGQRQLFFDNTQARKQGGHPLPDSWGTITDEQDVSRLLNVQTLGYAAKEANVGSGLPTTAS